jgi:dUTP pyrophosphatase
LSGRIRFKRLSPEAREPERAHDHDAGYDLRAAESARIEPGARASVGTGIAVAIPEGCAGLVLPRSGLAAKHGITLPNAPGLIDAGYRGEVRVLLLNTDADEPFEVAQGDRIAQLVVVRAEELEFDEAAELDETARAAGEAMARSFRSPRWFLSGLVRPSRLNRALFQPSASGELAASQGRRTQASPHGSARAGPARAEGLMTRVSGALRDASRPRVNSASRTSFDVVRSAVPT